MKKAIIGLCLILLSATCFAQQSKLNSKFSLSQKLQSSDLTLNSFQGYESSTKVFKTDLKRSGFDTEYTLAVLMSDCINSNSIFNKNYSNIKQPPPKEVDFIKR